MKKQGIYRGEGRHTVTVRGKTRGAALGIASTQVMRHAAVKSATFDIIGGRPGAWLVQIDVEMRR